MTHRSSWLLVTLLPLCFSHATAGDSVRLQQRVVRTLQAGLMPREFWFRETVSIEGAHLTLHREGGAKVAKGPWTTQLSAAEIQQLNTLIAAIDRVKDADIVSRIIENDAGQMGIAIGNDMVFRQGQVAVNSSHWFSKNVSRLFWAIQDILTAHALQEPNSLR